MSALRETPLADTHRRLGARMVEFAGFSMPVQYSSILDEHAAVRKSAGLFDVSHMGQIHLTGPGAVASAERLLTRPVGDMRPGRVRYALLCNEDGGVVDDVTIYRLSDDALFLCVNASNIEKDYRWVVRHARADAQVRDRSDETALIALQGPASAAVIEPLTPLALPRLRRYRCAQSEVAGVPALISRTGYTGADGFELYVDAARAVALFEALLEAGAPRGVRPAGLGARDTLRLEAALPLYGHELDDTTSPLEAGLDRFVALESDGFLGAEAIRRRRAAGHPRQLVGFELEERGIARTDYPIQHAGEPVGRVTSGGPSPTLGTSIGLGYVPPSLAGTGTRFEIAIRGRPVRARVVETPFVRTVDRARPDSSPRA
ncbi:MAG: glycine cleavage system aminomethyltransferase GcvT [Deltaproteobacteria bacterium]|nr:MAG: glycine cleavage system aminomethyltransferase GcvT [Deltaproteobacteria bacterium]